MLITNLHIIQPDGVLEHGALRIEDTQIAAIVAGDEPRERAARIVDGAGLIAMPGIIDIHGDMIEKEIEPRPAAFFPTDMAIHELDKRLAASGVTTAYAALSLWDVDRADHTDSVRGRDQVRVTINTLHRLRPHLLVDHAIHARYEVSTPSSVDLLHELLAARQIHLLSLMDHTPGQGQYHDLERYVSYIATYRQAQRDVVEHEAHERLRRARDSASEHWMLARACAAVAVAQGLPLASHDDDTDDKVARVAALGATISEFPVTLEAARAAKQRGMHVAMGAPNVLRGGSHSGNVSAQEAIAAGLVDTLASDYHPGALLQAVFVLAANGTLPLHEAAKLVGQNPADALGLPERGRLVAGCQADVALVEAGDIPRVRGVLRRGLPIYWDGGMAGRG